MTDHPVPVSAHPGARTQPAGLTFKPEVESAASERFPDFSEFQGAVDWSALGAAYRAGTIQAVAIRAGFGTVRADAQFKVNQAGARAQGIPVIYYWFNYPAYNAPTAEAAMFNATVGPLQPGEAMAGDFEDDPSARPFPRGQAGVDWSEAFLTALQAPQNATWWYTYPFLLSSVGLQPLFGTWPLWMADYSATPDDAFAPAIARQYTDCGSTPGVGGCCDQSRVLRGPLSQWLTPSTDPGPSTDTIGDCSMFEYNGTFHTFELGADGNVLWGRTTGGAGGQVHVGLVSIGGGNINGNGPVVEHREAPTSGGTIIVRAKYGNGMVQQTWLQADGPWPQTITWFGPDQQGPFGVQRGPAGPPGGTFSEAQVRAFAADEIEKRLANG